MFLKLVLVFLLQGSIDYGKEMGTVKPYENFNVMACAGKSKPTVYWITNEAKLTTKDGVLIVEVLDKKNKYKTVAKLKNCRQIGVTAIPVRKLDEGWYDMKKYIRRLHAR